MRENRIIRDTNIPSTDLCPLRITVRSVLSPAKQANLSVEQTVEETAQKIEDLLAHNARPWIVASGNAAIFRCPDPSIDAAAMSHPMDFLQTAVRVRNLIGHDPDKLEDFIHCLVLAGYRAHSAAQIMERFSVVKCFCRHEAERLKARHEFNRMLRLKNSAWTVFDFKGEGGNPFESGPALAIKGARPEVYPSHDGDIFVTGHIDDIRNALSVAGIGLEKCHPKVHSEPGVWGCIIRCPLPEQRLRLYAALSPDEPADKGGH